MTLSRIVFALAITLVFALVVAQFSPPDDLGRNFALLVGFMACAVLAGNSLLSHYDGQMGEALRNFVLWGAILAVVALAYAYKSNFGF